MLVIGLQRAVLSGVLQLAPDTEMVSAGPEGRQGARAEVGVVGYEAWLYVVAKSQLSNNTTEVVILGGAVAVHIGDARDGLRN